MKVRIVVTDMGIITSIGNDVESFWWGLEDEAVRIGPVTYLDTTNYRYKLAAEVKGLGPKQYVDTKAARRVEAFSRLTVTTSKKALERSGIDMEKGDLCRVGVCVRPDIGSLQAMEKNVKKLNGKGPSRVSPLLMSLMISDITADNVAIQFGLKGKRFSVVTACATGTHSAGKTFRFAQYGRVDVMVTGGAGTSIALIGTAEFTSLTTLSTTEGASRAPIPFGRDGNDFVMGEGVGVVALESLEHARVRGANTLAEVVGYGATCDAFHITSPAEDGSGATCAMGNAAKGAGMATEDTDYVNAHDASTHHDDLFGTGTIRLALGDRTEKVKINSTEFIIDHLLGAADGVEFITRIKSIQDGFIRTTVGLGRSEEDYDLDYAMGSGVSMNVDVAISNSLKLDGRSVSLIVKKLSE